jgi:hypothetical protein
LAPRAAHMEVGVPSSNDVGFLNDPGRLGRGLQTVSLCGAEGGYA